MPTFRQSALLRKEEAVSKGEIEKCARTVHLIPSFNIEASIYYKEAARVLSRLSYHHRISKEQKHVQN